MALLFNEEYGLLLEKALELLDKQNPTRLPTNLPLKNLRMFQEMLRDSPNSDSICHPSAKSMGRTQIFPTRVQCADHYSMGHPTYILFLEVSLVLESGESTKKESQNGGYADRGWVEQRRADMQRYFNGMKTRICGVTVTAFAWRWGADRFNSRPKPRHS